MGLVDGILRVFASTSIIDPAVALAQRGVKEFWFPREQGVTEKDIRAVLRKKGISVRPLATMDGLTNQIRIAVDEKDGKKTIRALDKSGLNWWGG